MGKPIEIHGFTMVNYGWLVVLTCFKHLKKYESQWAGLSHILRKNKKYIRNHQPAMVLYLWVIVNLWEYHYGT